MYCSIREFNEYDFTGNLDHIREVIYKYEASDMLEKLEMTKDKTKVFVFAYKGQTSKEDLGDINSLMEARDNIKIMYYDLGTGLLDDDKKPKGKYFYSFAVAADSLDMLVALLETGVSDVYITGSLGFSLKTVKHLCSANGANVRVIPNLATKSGFTNEQIVVDDTTSFWIRPDDLCLYEGYIDVVEFNCSNSKQSVFYDIYFQDQSWMGNLSDIVSGNIDINNQGLITQFGLYRMDCGKKCLLNLCHKCHKFVALSKLVVDNNLKIEVEEESI